MKRVVDFPCLIQSTLLLQIWRENRAITIVANARLVLMCQILNEHYLLLLLPPQKIGWLLLK